MDNLGELAQQTRSIPPPTVRNSDESRKSEDVAPPNNASCRCSPPSHR